MPPSARPSTHTGVQQCSQEEKKEDEQAQVQEVEKEVSISAKETRQMICLHHDSTLSYVVLFVHRYSISDLEL